MVLTIDTAATSRALLTTAQLRTAAGVTGSSRDTELAAVGLTVADIISRWCNVAGDGLTPPTLLRETVSQIFRPTEILSELILARRFLGTVTVVEDDVTLEATDFEIDASLGILRRLRDDFPARWRANKITVTYQAGFVTVPTPLADVASEMVARKTGAARDALLKRERVKVDGVEETEREFWVSEKNDTDITPDMAEKLSAFQTIAVG